MFGLGKAKPGQTFKAAKKAGDASATDEAIQAEVAILKDLKATADKLKGVIEKPKGAPPKQKGKGGQPAKKEKHENQTNHQDDKSLRVIFLCS